MAAAMAPASFGPLLLIAVTMGLLALPVTPALYELHKREDASPLPTSRHDGRITNFAESLRSRLEPLRSELRACRLNRELSYSSVKGMKVLVVGSEEFDFDPAAAKDVAVVMCIGSAIIPQSRVVDADIYTDEGLDLGEGSTLRAALAEGDIALRRNSSVLRWLHAQGKVHLGQGSSTFGRLSAAESIRLDRGSTFQHMNAPVILTLDSEDAPYLPVRCGCSRDVAQASLDPSSPATRIHGDTFAARPRIRVQGDFVLPAGEVLNANVVASGDFRLGRGARFLGSAKSYGNVVLEEEACVHGSLVCEGEIRIGPRCFVMGPVMAEREVNLARGSCVGEVDAPTTVSSRTVKIAAGCELHGSVWARSQGSVEG
ncbi:MAG: hypothetical protein WAN03_18425 [Candidatus Sulfotelmatobacter sp.]